MATALFTPSADGRVEPTEHARGPWDPRALHGGAPAALIAARSSGWSRARSCRSRGWDSSSCKPIPFAELEVTTEIVRNGRRVQELAAELADGGRRRPSDAASALRIQAVPEGLPDPDRRRGRPGPRRCERCRDRSRARS